MLPIHKDGSIRTLRYQLTQMGMPECEQRPDIWCNNYGTTLPRPDRMHVWGIESLLSAVNELTAEKPNLAQAFRDALMSREYLTIAREAGIAIHPNVSDVTHLVICDIYEALAAYGGTHA